ncbi:mRNA splicing protein [Xylographa bjoerkii]|nr:mRNA splicing protein [Xylographa bjoerkii]
MSRKPADVASKEKNEYIPTFISKKPFYIDGDDTASDYLEHQRLQKAATDQSRWYDRGKRLGPAATKFRKGACENCGAMTHKTQDCLSRPRAKGARWTGKDIQADEVVQDVDLGWDAKRDRWNGYDASEYRAVIEEYEEMESLKKQAKGMEVQGQKLLTEDGNEGKEGDGEEAKYAEESDMGRQQSTATRNLRLREDTAKYLLNLDLDSAKYDPKTRSMVDMGAQADQAAALVAEDNFMRASGDAAEFERAQKYAWESQERGDKNKTHIQANPTSGEYFLRKEKEEREAAREARQKMLLEKYGGEQHLQPAPLRNAAVIENDQYVEYDASGAIKGTPTAVKRSKYMEDVYINNHTTVWGSWWKDFQWGYACCHSTIKNSYCAGDEGRKAYEEADQIRMGGELEAMDTTQAIQRVTKQTESVQPNSLNDSVVKYNTEGATKKRTLAETKNGISEEELEVYKRSRTVADDPMLKLLGKDELVH